MAGSKVQYPTQEDLEKAEKTLEWVKSLSREQLESIAIHWFLQWQILYQKEGV